MMEVLKDIARLFMRKPKYIGFLVAIIFVIMNLKIAIGIIVAFIICGIIADGIKKYLNRTK